MGSVIYPLFLDDSTEPSLDTAISKLAVGSIVKIKENGTPVDYIKVHQGIPSSLYDKSCDGAWMLRKDLYENRQWNSGAFNDYEKSTVNAYLNGDFYRSLGSNKNIKQVKIPYRPGYGYNLTPINSGSSGLQVNVFLLSAPEVGITTANADGYTPMDGARLDFFRDGSGADPSRVATLMGENAYWWTRSPCCKSYYGNEYTMNIHPNGGYNASLCTRLMGIRPQIIIDNAALVDQYGNLIGG